MLFEPIGFQIPITFQIKLMFDSDDNAPFQGDNGPEDEFQDDEEESQVFV